VASSGWYADPLGRHEKRFFNGLVWTDRVSDGRRQASDPIGRPSLVVVPTRKHAPDLTTPPGVVAPPARNGFAVAALTIVALGAVIALMMYIGVSFSRITHPLREAFVSSAPSVVDAHPTRNRVHITDCSRIGDAGSAQAAGTLVNTGSKEHAFRVTIAFHVGKITVVSRAMTAPLTPGETGTWMVRDLDVSFDPTSCTVVTPKITSP